MDTPLNRSVRSSARRDAFMTTTILFAELIIIGLQVLVWLSLLVLIALPSAQYLPADVDKWHAPLTAAVLALSYTLGTVFDRLFDSLFSRWNEKLKVQVIPNPDVPIVVMRYTAALGNEDLNRLLEYTRSRMRIARATTVNAPLIAATLSTFLWVRLQSDSGSSRLVTVAVILAVATGIAVISGFAWLRFMRTYLEVVRKHYTALCQPKSADSVPSRQLAAPDDTNREAAGAAQRLTLHEADALQPPLVPRSRLPSAADAHR